MTRRRWAARAAALAIASVVLVLTSDLRQARRLRDQPRGPTSFMRRRGTVAAPPFTPLGAISPWLVCAVVKAEDRSFFRHHGLDWAQLWRAGRLFVDGESRMGGSTITQQLARNLFLTPERSVWRKLREATWSAELEAALPKRRLLELYLNVVEWGDGVWGIAEASQRYFGKQPAALDLTESLLLASLLPAPRRPLSGDNLARAAATQERVLYQLERSRLIDRAVATSLGNELQKVRATLEREPDARLEAALAATPAAPSIEPPSLASVLDGECGLDAELQVARDAARRRSLTRR